MLKEHVAAVGDISIPKGLGIYLLFEFSPNSIFREKKGKKDSNALLGADFQSGHNACHSVSVVHAYIGL